MVPKLFVKKSEDFAYANNCICMINEELKTVSKDVLSKSKKTYFLQFYCSIEEFLKKANTSSSETKKLHDKMQGLQYRLTSAGVLEAKSTYEYLNKTNSESKNRSKFYDEEPQTREAESIAPPRSNPPKRSSRSRDFQEEEDTYISPTLPDYDSFSPEEDSDSTVVLRQKPQTRIAESEATDFQTDNREDKKVPTPAPRKKQQPQLIKHFQKDEDTSNNKSATFRDDGRFLPKRASTVVEPQKQQANTGSKTEPTNFQTDRKSGTQNIPTPAPRKRMQPPLKEEKETFNIQSVTKPDTNANLQLPKRKTLIEPAKDFQKNEETYKSAVSQDLNSTLVTKQHNQAKISSETKPPNFQTDGQALQLPKRKTVIEAEVPYFESKPRNQGETANYFNAPKFKSFSNYDKKPSTKLRVKISNVRKEDSEEAEDALKVSPDSATFLNFPKKKKGASSADFSEDQEDIPIDPENKTFDFEELEILTTEKLMEHSFDFESLQRLNPDEAMARLQKYSEILDPKVQNFKGVVDSLEYVLLEEQLTKTIEALNKIKCEDTEVSSQKDRLVRNLKNLLEFLQNYEEEDEDEDEDEDEGEDEDDD